jgi:signal transduction histidine kinase
VWADEFKIEEVVTNYVSNALNHLGGERVISIIIEELGEDVRVTVRNTGLQIPQEALPNLWTKFYKVDKARTRADILLDLRSDCRS